MSPLILSYPRCGSNFLWYSLNEMTKISCGKSHAQDKGFWENKENNYKLIFIIRNYKECIPRQINKYFFGDLFKSQISNFRPDSSLHHFDYISVLDYYDKFEGEKMIVYYEDLMLDTSKSLIDIIKFLLNDNIDDEINNNINNYLNNIEYHKNKSSDRYNSLTPVGCQSINGSDVDIFYHSKKIEKIDLIKIDKYLSNNYKYLYKTYLSRYYE